MKWRIKTPWCMESDAGYVVAKSAVGEQVMYRPSYAGEFIAPHVSTSAEAKQVCERYAREAANA